MSLGDKLRQRRQEMGLTRPQLAAKICVTPSAIANYENGVSYPKPDILVALMNALDVDANYLYRDYLSPRTIQRLYRNVLRPEEKESILKYRELSESRKSLVRLIIDEEYKRMNQSELISKVAGISGESRKAVEAVLKTTADVIAAELREGVDIGGLKPFAGRVGRSASQAFGAGNRADDGQMTSFAGAEIGVSRRDHAREADHVGAGDRVAQVGRRADVDLVDRGAGAAAARRVAAAPA